MRSKYFILFLIFLSACMPQAQTVIVENTIAPSTTPEIINAVTSLPTATLSEVDKIFVIPTHDPSFSYGSTQTPIATPNNTSNQLRDLSEKDYINWIKDLQTYSYQNYPPYGDWWSEGMFISSQLPLALVIQEFLYLYPNSVHAERLKWQLAFIDSLVFRYITVVGGNIYDDKWVINELEKEINQGKFLPDEMEVFLDQYWFDVDYYQPIENLFGDNEISWFYVISPQVWEHEEEIIKSPDHFRYGGMLLVIRKVDNDKFKIYLLENAWSFVNGSSSLFEISDFNQNGITEIALDIRYHGGSMCSGNLSIYEWNDNVFTELTKSKIRIRDCVERYEYVNHNGMPVIKLFEIMPRSESLYIWNGQHYEFSEYLYSNLVEKWYHAATYSEEAKVIEEILSSENLEGLSFGQIDFLRYRLGILYALESNEQEAIQTLQSLADNPSDVAITAYSDFAKRFLRYYSGDKDLSTACQESGEILSKTNQLLTSKSEEEVFGISFDFYFGPGLLGCSTHQAFKFLIENTSIEKDIINELRNNGVSISYSERRDVNLDGLTEELLITYEDTIYVVFPNGTNYDVNGIDSFWYEAETNSKPKIELLIDKWNDIDGAVFIVFAGNNLSITNISKDFQSTYLGFEYDVVDLISFPNSIPTQYEVFLTEPKLDTYYQDTPWKGYRWDSNHKEFRADLFEYKIFVENDIEGFVEVADKLLPILNDWSGSVNEWSNVPRYYYLCALAYELAGDSQKAAEIYYQLWREFPESHYARMAKFKLEPINP